MHDEETKREAPLRAVSVDLELSALAGAARSAQILVDLHLNSGLLEVESEEDALPCASSVLGLLGGRLGQLRRVLRGEEKVAHLWAPHNSVAPPTPGEECPQDIILLAVGSFQMPIVMWRPCTGEFMPKGAPRAKQREEEAPEETGAEGESPAPSEPC